MAKTKDVDITGPQTLGLPEGEFEWETVHTEAPDQITFDEIDDTFVGEYIGQEVIEFENTREKGDGPNGGAMESFTQIKFRVGDRHYVTNAGYDLLKAFEDVPIKSIVRVSLKILVDVGQASPMKSYRVDVARNTGAK